MHTEHDKPILTLAQVQNWQIRMAEIANSIRAMQEEAADLTRKLDAAKVIMGELPEPHESEQMTMVEIVPPTPARQASPDATSVTASVVAAVGALGHRAKPPAIRQWISDNRPLASEKLQTTPQYLYSVLKRLRAGKRLIKERGVYRVPASSPRGEAGAGDPGSH